MWKRRRANLKGMGFLAFPDLPPRLGCGKVVCPKRTRWGRLLGSLDAIKSFLHRSIDVVIVRLRGASSIPACINDKCL